jgi:tRNA(fMet)-specific endonuclease VapC
MRIAELEDRIVKLERMVTDLARKVDRAEPQDINASEFVRLRVRIAQLDPPQSVTTTVITYEEQSRGRLASVNAARTAQELVAAYANLRQHLNNYSSIRIIAFDDTAATTAEMLRSSKLRLGTMDLRIASIALTRDALLLSRNLRDFQKVPGLRVEDWTRP